MLKKFFIVIATLMMSAGIYAKDIQEIVVTTTPPMSCQNCENKIKGNLRFEKGVKKIETNLAEQRVTIEYDAEKTTPEKIEDAFKKIGYQVSVIEQSSTPQPKPKTAPLEVNPSTQTTGCTGSCCKN